MASDFLYGAATSAHQVEGNNIHNDWWQWEQHQPPHKRSGRATDHYRLFKQDFALAENLGHTAHRLSLEWSRLEPRPKQWNRPAIEHYREVLLELRRHKLKSFVTLHHFTNPQWFSARGGWLRSDAPELFADYVRVVVEYLGDLVDYWITINEPMVYATESYWRKRWPPHEHSFLSLYRVIDQLAQAHGKAYQVIHRLKPQARVGIAQHFVAYLTPPDNFILDVGLNRACNWWFNHRFFSLTAHTHDFLGVNYYFSHCKKITLHPLGQRNVLESSAQSDLQWPIYPPGLTHVLKEAGRYHLPIYITENGLADAADKQRADYIRSHLRAVEKAQADGIDVRGYLHWSLLDNFEWDLGFSPRFGLVEVDYQTMQRTPRPSAYVYKAIIESATQNYSG